MASPSPAARSLVRGSDRPTTSAAERPGQQLPGTGRREKKFASGACCAAHSQSAKLASVQHREKRQQPPVAEAPRREQEQRKDDVELLLTPRLQLCSSGFSSADGAKYPLSIQNRTFDVEVLAAMRLPPLCRRIAPTPLVESDPGDSQSAAPATPPRPEREPGEPAGQREPGQRIAQVRVAEVHDRQPPDRQPPGVRRRVRVDEVRRDRPLEPLGRGDGGDVARVPPLRRRDRCRAGSRRPAR